MRAALLIALLFACDGGEEGDDMVSPDGGSPDRGVVMIPGDLDGDEWPEEMDNCPGLANPEQRDRDGDGFGDACDSCPATPNGGVDGPAQDECDPVDETEPNDAPGSGEAVSLVELGRIREVRGTIEAPSPNQAFDRFQIMVPARTKMKVRVARAKPESLLEPIVMVSGGAYTVPRIAHGLFTAEREIYVAEAGTYEIAVADRRGVLAGDPRGSDSYAYALAIEVIDASAEQLVAPFVARPFVLEPPGSIAIFQADVEASSFVRIATETALGMGAPEGLDTILIVERADGTVIENDDLADGFLDSRVILDLPAPETLRIAIDHHRIHGSDDLEVRLTLDTPATNVELEPNDVINLASRLVFPGETAGKINEVPETGPGDVDWYRFEGTAGQIIALTGLIPAASQVDPLFLLARLRDEATGALEPLYLNLDSAGLAPRIEAILHETGTYFLGVADQRNGDTPPFIGSNGDLMRYGIFAEPVGLQPEAVILTDSGTISASLAIGGRLARHLVIAAGPTIVDARTIAVSHPDVEPFIRIYGPNASGLLDEGDGEAIAYLDVAETHILAVHNGNDGRGDPTYNYEIFVKYIPTAGATIESEPNDDRASADAMNTIPSVARGTLTEADRDFFRVALVGSSTVSIDVAGAGAPRNITLYDGAGTFLRGGAGSIRDFIVPATGDCFIEVSGVDGPYDLIVR